MAYELVYTSAPQGINRGSSGFCVVACTNGLGPRLIAALEGFSAYKPLYPHYAENAWDNPISRQHYIFEANGERQHILSRICFNGVDYTGRSNKLASHLVLSRSETEKVPGGPAALLMHEELFKNADWTIKPEHYDRQLPIPSVAGHRAKCETWGSVTGDAGWGGYLAQCFLDDPQRNVYLVYRPELNRIIPKLFDEAINLLPEDKRWQVTFNTYFVALPAGGNCAWRGVPADSDALRAARRSPANIVIDLDKPGTLTAAGKLIDFARTGVSAEPEKVPVQEPIPTEEVEVAPPVDEQPEPTETTPSQEETPEIPVDEPERPEVVEIRRSVVTAAAPRKSAKWPIFAAAAVLLAAVLAVGAFFVVGSIREQRAYRQALDNCQKLRQTLDMVEEEFGTLERDCKTAEARIEKLGELIATAEAVEEKIDTTPETQARFDDALGSGKLTDPQNTPDAVKKSCVRLKNELNDALKKAKLARSKKRALPAPAKQLPKPKEEKKKAEKPVENKPEQKAETPKPAPGPKAEPKKNLAKPDDPRTLWKKTEPLYAKGTKKISVTVALGNAKRDDIKIRLLPDNTVCKPGEELKFMDGGSGDNVVIKTEYDESAGVLTITGDEYKYQLLKDRRITVSVGDTEYPLFFKAEFSRPIIGKTRMAFPASDKGVVSLRITGTQLPERIFRGNSQVDQAQYVLKYGGKKYPMLLKKGELKCTFDDGELSKCRKREAALKKLKKQVETEPEKYILKIGSDDLKKNENLRSLMEDWKEFRKQNDSLLRRANAVKKKFGIKQITSLRKFHDDLPEDAEEKWGKTYKGWAVDYDKWNEMSRRLGSELIEKAPMNLLWSDQGDKTLKAELEARRQAVKARKEGLFKERYFLVISDAGGAKINEIELDIK